MFLSNGFFFKYFSISAETVPDAAPSTYDRIVVFEIRFLRSKDPFAFSIETAANSLNCTCFPSFVAKVMRLTLSMFFRSNLSNITRISYSSPLSSNCASSLPESAFCNCIPTVAIGKPNCPIFSRSNSIRTSGVISSVEIVGSFAPFMRKIAAFNRRASCINNSLSSDDKKISIGASSDSTIPIFKAFTSIPGNLLSIFSRIFDM